MSRVGARRDEDAHAPAGRALFQPARGAVRVLLEESQRQRIGEDPSPVQHLMRGAVKRRGPRRAAWFSRLHAPSSYSIYVQRRTFLNLPLGAALLEAQTPAAAPRAILELRYYHLRSGKQVEKTTAYLQHGLVPAAQRAGIRTLGCFSALIAPDTPFMLTLASYPSMAALDAAREKLAADKEFQPALAEYNTAGELSFMRMENSLLWAFPSLPQVTPPPASEKAAARVFEIRTYESPTETGLARKIDMFGRGEFDIFRRLHMLPVFAGETIVGTHLPNLTYMLAFDDLAAREKCWAGFQADPEWQKLRTTGGIPDAELVSNITNTIVRALPFSPVR